MPLRHRDAPFLSQFPDLKLLRQDGSTVPASEAFRGKKYVLIYFSAHWCPPCQRFTPLLADFYDTHKNTYDFEVLFVSSDREESRMMDFFQNRSSNYVRRPASLEQLSAGRQDALATAAAAAAAATTPRAASSPVLSAAADAAQMACDITSDSKMNSPSPSSSPVAETAAAAAAAMPQGFPAGTVRARAKEPRGLQGGPRIPKASGHGNWLALPFKETEVARSLSRAYSVVSIPKLVVVAVDTSCMVTREGKVMVMKDPDAAQFPWRFAEGSMTARQEGRRECVALFLLLIVGLYYYIWGF